MYLHAKLKRIQISGFPSCEIRLILSRYCDYEKIQINGSKVVKLD